MGIENTEPGKQAIRMRPAQERVWREVFDIKKIQYMVTRTGEVSWLDRKCGIDAFLHLNNNHKIAVQQKALTHACIKHRTFTIEYEQVRLDRATQFRPHEYGEFYKGIAQLILSGYSDETGVEYEFWHIINWASMRLWLLNCPDEYLRKQVRHTFSKDAKNSSFIYIYWSDIPQEFIYASGKGPGETQIVWNRPELPRAFRPNGQAIIKTDQKNTIIKPPKQQALPLKGAHYARYE
jgi:hypothetical protein